MKMVSPIHHRPNTWDINTFKSVSGGHEYGELNLVGRDVIDIGAHIGGFTYYAGVNGAEKIVSVEANPDNYEYLLKNIEAFELMNVYPVNMPVWYKAGDFLNYNLPAREFNTGGGFVSENTIQLAPGKHTGLVTTDLESLFEKYSMNNVVLKLDCEGSEYPILYGAPKSVIDNIGMIVGEYHSRQVCSTNFDYDKTPKGLEEFLRDNGFQNIRFVAKDKTLGFFGAERG